jgi:hypothetical protein
MRGIGRNMPVTRKPADIMCLAIYTPIRGRLLQGRMLMTMARQLGITFDQAHKMAEAAAKAGLIQLVHGSSVSLTGDGFVRGAALKPADPHPRAKRRPR